MSEETKKAPEAEAGTPEPDKVQDGSAETAAEQPASPGAGSGEAAAAPEAEAAKDEPKKKDGWFNKKNREAEALKAKLDAAEKNAAQLKDQLLRVAAEYDNYRKRTSREADQKFNDGVSYAVGQIIPILDTLEMAANAPCADENYKKGVTMTLEKAGRRAGERHRRHRLPEGLQAGRQDRPPRHRGGGRIVRPAFHKRYPVTHCDCIIHRIHTEL